MHVGLCLCYRILSAEVDVLKGTDCKCMVNKTLAILGCYTAYVGSVCRRFGTAIGPIFKGQAVQGRQLTLEDETVA